MILVSGIAVVDLIASGLPRVAALGELVFGSIRPTLGGHASNVSVDLVRLGFQKSRLRVVLPAGRDVFGRFLVDGLRKEGVRVEAVLAAPGTPTSIDLILVAKGEDRRYHVDPGANIVFPPAKVTALIGKYRPRIFYAGGTGLLNRMDARLDGVLRAARRAGAVTFVDVVSPYAQSWDYLRRALPWTDFFHCNVDEAAELTGERDPRGAIVRLRSMGGRFIFLTDGERGVAAALPGAILKVPAFSVDVTDPTGAGDAFSAGLILKVYEAMRTGTPPDRLTVEGWKSILTFASACGAVCCTGVGTTTAVSAAAAAKLVRRYGKDLASRISVETL